VYQGAEAVFRLLKHAAGFKLLSLVGRLPVIRWVAQGVYRLVARHRRTVSRLDRWLVGRSTKAPAKRGVRWLFLRAVGVVYLIAFTSLRRQVLGLYGSRGISPIAARLKYLEPLLGEERHRAVPSLFWLGASDESLVRACQLGQALSVALICNVAPRAALVSLWALYLSFVSAGNEFLSFQWDALLLETSVHAWLVTPRGLRPKLGREEPIGLAVLAMRWLAFRLQYESGIAKLRSGDPTWKDRTALAYHFETQPLPTPLGWYAHHLPRNVQRLATRLTLFTENVVPFLAFAPRRPRHVGFGLLSGLQLAIAATGNYAFFNLLTVILNLWLLDDSAMGQRFVPRSENRARRASGIKRVAVDVAACALLAATSSAHLARYGRPEPRPALLRALSPLQPSRSINTYGLFSVMTTERPEIAIEGSNDKIAWHEYGFRYKPTDPLQKPRWVAPHQPRLDWQMWFAALGPPPPWFELLLVRLLEGSPEVLALFGHCPFPDRPPRFVRALLYDYKFTDLETRRTTGAWWRRELVGLYFPAVSLSSNVEETARAPAPGSGGEPSSVGE
jgi:hypothetical protein